MTGEQLRYSRKLAVIFAAYFITARIGLSLDAVSGFATLVWAPTGIALAAILILGYRYWPGIMLAAFLVNLTTEAPPLVALGISIGNTLEALVGAYLLNRFVKFQKSLERVKDVLGLVVLAALFSTLVSATIGVLSLLLGGVITASAYGSTWIAWWVGDMLGALVVAPLLLVWSERLRTAIDLRRFFKAMIPVVILIAVSIPIFHGFLWAGIRPFMFAYIIFPILIWIALRFNQHGSVTATFIVSVVAIWGTIASFDTSSGNTLTQNLLLLQSFIGVTAVTFMTMAAVVSEREKTQKHQQHLIHRTILLTKQRQRLKALNQAKDEFISVASHQLRTPATGVKQYIGLLLQDYAGKLSPDQHRYAEIAYESNERQLKVINDLLHVARLDSGKLHVAKTNCDISQLIADVIDQQSKEFERRGQKLTFSPSKKPVKARLNKDLMHMVLENIIDNAGKYSPKGGEISVSVVQANKQVKVRISDRGIGIDKKDQKKLFRKFSRLPNSRSSDVNGSGLGLYWAKKVIHMHGGSISLTSKLNQGSTFIISLPTNS